ncbi:MAG TPA: hypothetical protein VHX11_01840, partial [Acidobacteriaceae bacterium]|nr:hypothetical protein [Acidobacteriaceae bacterium]
MRFRFAVTLLLLSVTFASASQAWAGKESLGQVHFPTSCRPQVQPDFDTGVALLHSFEFTEAEQAFERVEKNDPRCVIAAWGVALAITQRSGANAPRKDLAEGWAQLQPWLGIQAGTDREEMYLDAVRSMYEGYDKVSGQERWNRYLLRMQEIRRKYPDDINASLFYGLGLVWTAGPGEQGLQRRKEALAIFFPIFKQYPDNPGAAHYIIHAADTAELAPEALPAARKYAAIAPDSPHALHMPSHIFNRLGYWNDSIATNRASARVAADWLKAGRDARFDELHALNNLEYGYLQLGKDSKAKEVISEIANAANGGTDPWPPVDARIYYDMETHDWRDAMKIEPPFSSKFEENFDTYWVRTIAAARTGNPREAAIQLEQYRKSSAAWEREHAWTDDILGLALAEAEAWTMYAQGQHDEAVQH